ncbi:hypothetical protein DL764_005381 [Monosporascus ibericus]|uniref:BTB domain-containing protein n=1 Tax=Monosporascus ibericus TaxID=155417 RepID=A0A4Q4T9H4_9PEZI|nr:hypothetical protein DL764_005381 [Monosporascus ibericus]
MVTIQIPPGERSTAHAILLARHSKYFRAALNSAMKEATTLHSDLTEHATKFCVGRFVKWLYARPLLSRPGFTTFSLWFERAKDEDLLAELCTAWLLGDYLQAAEFKNLVMRFLVPMLENVEIWRHPLLHHYPSLGDVYLNSKLHDLLVDSLAYLMTEDKASAMTDTKLILERLDVDTTTKLLQRFVINARAVRREAGDALTSYDDSRSYGEGFWAAGLILHDTLSSIEVRKITYWDGDGVPLYLDEEE